MMGDIRSTQGSGDGNRNSSCGGVSPNGADLCWLNAVEISDLYQRKQLSPIDVVSAVLNQAKQVAQRYNAFVSIDEEGAMIAARASEDRWFRGEPRGGLDGIPATIKDLMTVKGWHTRFGSATTADIAAPSDAPSVATLRAAGAILIGATTTSEFGWKGVADSPLFGITANPHNSNLTCGGSSGGAAVAALMGCGNLHLGTDGGGSIRIPASFTGVVGHKPSFGRVPYHPPSAFGTVGHIGPITRTAIESALMLDAMTIRDVRDWNQPSDAFKSSKWQHPWDWRDKKVGVWLKPPIGGVDPEITAAVRAVAKSIESAGARINEVTLPGDNLIEAFNTIWFAGAANRLAKIDRNEYLKLDQGLRVVAELGNTYSAAQYADALLTRAVFGSEMDKLLSEHHLLISPTTPCVAFTKNGEVPPGSIYNHWTEWAGFNFPLNLSQQPACSVPIGLTDARLPIGLQVIGARGHDNDVLSAVANIALMVGDVERPKIL